MNSDRLKANTPSKWTEQNSALEGLKAFILVSMLAFAAFLAIFLVLYLLKPLEVRVFIRSLEEWIHNLRLSK